MTREGWKDYLKKFKEKDYDVHLAESVLFDWNNNIEEINKKLNYLQDEIFKLNKDIN